MMYATVRKTTVMHFQF